MRCPYCSHSSTRVIDSRFVGEGEQVRRRRECEKCKERFTTYEAAELNMPRIVKARDKHREPFSEEKLRAGMDRALRKRPVETDRVEAAPDVVTIGSATMSVGEARPVNLEAILGAPGVGGLT